jgi:hypothetical protein
VPQVKLRHKDHLNPEMELIYDTSNHNPRHRGVEEGVLDLDLVTGEEGMGGDEVDIMVR